MQNCESECEMNYLYDNCNCVLYYHPRSQLNTTVCGYSDANCAKRVDREIRIKQNSSFQCTNCLSGCYAITYDTAFSTARISETAPFLKKHNVQTRNIAVLHTYYDSLTVRSQTKEEFISFTDFLCKLWNLFKAFKGE